MAKQRLDTLEDRQAAMRKRNEEKRDDDGDQLAFPFPPESRVEILAEVADKGHGFQFRQAARAEKRRKRRESGSRKQAHRMTFAGA